MSDVVTAVSSAPASRWRNALLILVGLCLLLLLSQWQLAQDMANIWLRSKTFNHCLIIPLISCWLIHERRREVLGLSPQVSPAGLLLLAFAAVLLLFAELAGVAVVGHFALILSVQALAWTVLGTEICRRLLFPLLYLWFAVPFGEFLVPKLQDITADMAVGLLRLFEIPVFRDGHFIALPNGDFLVEEACSGISYLIASLALGTLYAYLQYRSYYRRAAFILLSIIVPIIANGVRAFGIILIAHLTNNEYAVGVDHLIYGWIFFGIVMFLLFLLGRSFADGGPQPLSADALAPVPVASKPLAVLLPALLLIMLPALVNQRPNLAAREHYVADPLPSSWQTVPEERLGLNLVGAKQQIQFSDGVVQVIAGYFPQESRRSELVNTNHRFYDSARWRRLQADTRLVAATLADGVRLDNGFGEIVLAHGLYLFSAQVYGPGWQAKWHQLQARLNQQPAPALYLVVMRPAQLSDAELDTRLMPLLSTLQQGLLQAGSITP